MAAVTIPGIADLMLPALKAVHNLGGSALRSEILAHVRESASLTDEQIAAVYPGSGRSRVLHSAEWAIYWLKAIGALENSSRGVYVTTPDGGKYLGMADAEADAALRTAYRDLRERAGKRAAATRAARVKSSNHDEGTETAGGVGPPDAPVDVDADGAISIRGDDWKVELSDTLKRMDPAAFERLAQRLLREAGFQRVDVVGRAGDGGIDGVGVYKMSLVSFPIYFQCKRYAGGVGASVVRDFRGAMAGRGDKGLIVTTGVFTPGARAEATKDGAPPVDLIDGDELCDLIREYRLGVRVVERTVQDVTVDTTFFERL